MKSTGGLGFGAVLGEEEEEAGLEAFNEEEEEESGLDDFSEEEEEGEVVFVVVADDIFCFPFIDTGDCLLVGALSLFSLVRFKPFLLEPFPSIPGRKQRVSSQRAAKLHTTEQPVTTGDMRWKKSGFHAGFLVGEGELGGPLKPRPPDLTPAK